MLGGVMRIQMLCLDAKELWLGPEPWLLVGHFNCLCERQREGTGPLVSSCRVDSEELHPCYNAVFSSTSGGLSSMTAHIVCVEGGRSQRLRPLSAHAPL